MVMHDCEWFRARAIARNERRYAMRKNIAWATENALRDLGNPDYLRKLDAEIAEIRRMCNG